MSKLQRERVLSNLPAENFIGRTNEFERLLLQIKDGGENRGILLLSAPALGTSELLKQTYDRIFYDKGEIIPFYFAVKRGDKTVKQTAVRFAQNFLCQTIAFRRRIAKILDFGGDLCELAEMAIPGDAHWIERIVDTCTVESQLNDERTFIRNCLSSPLRAFANGARSFVMIDDLHEAEYLAGATDLLDEVKEIFAKAEIPFVLAGRRRFLFNSARLENCETIQLEPLNVSDAGLLAENLAARNNIKINEQTRDLIAVQFRGNPTFIKFLLKSAGEKKVDLDSFQNVEKIYADEVFGGQMGKFYDSMFEEVIPNIETQKQFISLLSDALTIDKEKNPIESWQFRTNLDDNLFYRTMRLLNTHEFIRLSSNMIEPMIENEILSDYLLSRYRLEIAAQPRVMVVAEALKKFLKRAPHLMAKYYRFNSALGLRELLGVFNCQEIPKSLLEYDRFKDRHKGAETAEILENLEKETEKIVLPQIVYTANTIAFYPPISQFTEKERSAVALGFETAKYTDENEIVWIAAEIDSKLEASPELTEFWCDRLEMVALMCNFSKYRLWLVAPEGFSPGAVEVLWARNAFGSSRKQVDLLVKYLRVEGTIGEKIKLNEYEMVVPMGEDTELIAAHTVEEIARRHNFPPKAINQIKTALVEACINAAEHSLSPDRKIYQKFKVEDDKIIITISNRGLRLNDKKAKEITPHEGRRGWGLKLMKTLMDEVKFEQVDDGTRISMVKYLKPEKAV